MTPAEILVAIEGTKGHAKHVIIKEHRNNQLFRRVLLYTYDPYKRYHVRPKSIPVTRGRNAHHTSDEKQWNMFFDLLDRLDAREVTGGDAIDAAFGCFAQVLATNEVWMRKVLDHHLNIGFTANTVNKIFKELNEAELIPSFRCQLAEQYWDKKKGRIAAAGKFVNKQKLIAVEPKLDGYRCLAIVRNGECILYSREGKCSDVMTHNFLPTIVTQLAAMNKAGKLGDVVLDGELMGRNFKATQQMVLRKNRPANIDDFFLNVFDWMPLNDWMTQTLSMDCQTTREQLEDMNLEHHCRSVRLVERYIVAPSERKKYHDLFVKRGFEGVMLKTLQTTYKFRRGKNVVKYKEFEDVDVECVGFEEGKVGSKTEGVLGAIVILNPNEDEDGNPRMTRVKVGGGFSDDEREEIWNNRSFYRGMFCTVEYQPPLTEDGALRFGVFKMWRPDKTDK